MLVRDFSSKYPPKHKYNQVVMSASLGFYLIDNWLSLTFESICLSVSSYLSHSWIGKRREKSIIIIALLWTCSRCKNFDLIHYYYWETTTLVRTSRWTRTQDHRSSWQVTGYPESHLHNLLRDKCFLNLPL